MEIIKQIPGLFLGSVIYFICNIMDMHNKFICVDKFKLELSPEQAEKIVRKDCNDFLKTYKGLSYLYMKYPNLSVSQAINEHIKEALWIDSIV